MSKRMNNSLHIRLLNKWDGKVYSDDFFYDINDSGTFHCTDCGHSWKMTMNAQLVRKQPCTNCTKLKRRKLVQEEEEDGFTTEQLIQMCKESSIMQTLLRWNKLSNPEMFTRYAERQLIPRKL